jgi:hypothetical protein
MFEQAQIIQEVARSISAAREVLDRSNAACTVARAVIEKLAAENVCLKAEKADLVRCNAELINLISVRCAAHVEDPETKLPELRTNYKDN